MDQQGSVFAAGVALRTTTCKSTSDKWIAAGSLHDVLNDSKVCFAIPFGPPIKYRSL